MDPQIRRRRTFAALKRLFLCESLQRPLILIFEDLHWIDSETQGFLDTLSEGIASAKILLLVNYRPEYRHEWGQKTYYTQLRLAPLGQAEAAEMVDVLLGASVGVRGQWNSQAEAAPLQALKQLILEKTEGNPFFMAEIVQALFEQGVLVRDAVGAALRGRPQKGTHIGVPLQGKPLTDLHIPATVQAVLAARIDRLPPEEKDFLQTLAVIGKEFSWSLLKQVVDKSEDELHRLLSHLQAAEFIYEQPAFPEVEYTFKHALTQEVAYNSLLQERRRVLHERVAQAMEALFHSRLEDHYSELAHHYSRSDNTEKAIEYLQRAGQQTTQRSANAEAINHLTTALELLKTLPDTLERAQQELMLQIALGPPLIVTKGSGVPEVEHAYIRARELCRQVGETPQLFPTLLGLSVFHMVRAEYRTARELGEQCLSLAQRVQDPALITGTYSLLGMILHHLGEFPLARAHAEQGIALYDPQQPRSWLDHGVGCLSIAALALWLLGYPDQAFKRSQEALTLAQELFHPSSLGFALYFAAGLHQYRREAHAAQERAEAAITLSTEQGLPTWLANSTVQRGWALAEQGQGEAGIAQLRQGLAAHRATGEEVGRPYFLALLAEAYGKAGQAEEGLAALAEALAQVEKTGERFYEAELYQLKGELTLQSESQGQKPEVEKESESYFWKAIEIARKQQAKSLELRAVMSLARLWPQQGKTTEAHQLLSEIYGWFTEGFDTADLQEAKALLDELA